MIAYNHTIEFLSQLQESAKKVNASIPTVTIKENNSTDFRKSLYVYMDFLSSQGRHTSLYSDRIFAPTQKGQLWSFEVKNVMTFFWYSGTLELHYRKQKNFTEDLLRYWTLHIVLPFFFTIEERYDFLHAGAVEIEGKPVLFTAESFGGKSTMTDYFLQKGHALVSDDKVATHEVDGKFICTASIPFHRPYRKLEDLGYFVENITQIPKPIHAIYALERSEPDAKISIIALFGIEKFKVLRYSSEYNLSFLKTKRFAYLTRLAKIVPVFNVTVPWDMERLDEVYECIVNHSKIQSL